MPWAVNECGRRGATGAGRELLMFVDCATGASFAADTAAVLPAISVRFSGLPEPPAVRQCRARLVGRRGCMVRLFGLPRDKDLCSSIHIRLFSCSCRLS